MDSARLEAVEAIFHAALETAPDERDRLLAERCGGDVALRGEVEALLAAHGRTGGFIETPIAVLDEGLFADEEPDRLVGQTIGHYEITGRIGSGGMGAVYRARRADRQYEKQVAIKLIRRGMDTEAMLRRFRNERQILAGLDHPNIARLLDGATTDDGLPYFVMEYVEGVPIDAYCDERKLGVTGRLELFRAVCAAVAYAHRHAVIHRDLKPSNILVDADGVPKLLDFGIARLLQTGDGPDPQATLVEQRIMTPDYASPEHLRGESVTTATDVYSLGVILYRLLTGQAPYRVRALSAEDAARAVGETAAPRPSAVVEEPARRRLRGDLDNIVLMALRKEPERRYSSVEQFSEDIRRHLESLPVLARRDTLAYRAGKFVRRNTAASLAAALVAVSLLGGIVMTTRQAERARAEAARAEHRFDEVRRLARSVIFDYHDAIKDLAGATAIRERLVEDGLAYLDSLASEAGDDPELQRELAAAYDRVGDVRGGSYSSATLGDDAGAMDSYLKALGIREILAAASPEDVQNRRDLAASYRKVGTPLIETADAERGREYLRKGLAVLQRLAADHPANPEIQQELGTAYNSVGLAMEDAGDAAGALEHHRKALALREALAAADPGDARLRRSVVISNINLGRALVLTGDFQGGLESNRKALAICEALVEEQPSNADYRRLLANTWQNDGDYRAILGDVEGAMQSFRRKLVFDKRSMSDDPQNAVARLDAGYSHERLGMLLGLAGRHADALSQYREALVHYESARARTTEDLSLRFRLILTEAGMGEMQAHLGDRAAAIVATGTALAMLDEIAPEPKSGSRSSLRGQVLMRVAAAYAALGESAEAGKSQRQQDWQRARELFAQSQAVWQDMQSRGTLTAEDRTIPALVAREIARCEAALRQLTG